MAVEVFANQPQTSLNGSINNSTTSIVVSSASGFPLTGNFRIIVESEIMIVTGVAGTTFTVLRGQESTAASAHSGGVLVTCVLTAGALQTFGNDSAWSGLAPFYNGAGGWADFGGTFELGAYMKDRTGRVWLRGLANNSSPSANSSLVMTLPAGFRPPTATILFNLFVNGTTPYRFDFATDGTVKVVVAGGIPAGFLAFNGQSFSTV